MIDESLAVSLDILPACLVLFMCFAADFQLGLTSAAAAQRLAENGPNALKRSASVPLWMLFLSQFVNVVCSHIASRAVLMVVIL